MITIRKASERGRTKIGWLDSRHTFSFGEYYDPAAMGFRVLRVLNDDRVAAGAGFPTHAHRDMEIISYVLEGGLEHRDSLGTGSVIRPGDVQRMSAGTGVRHSEFNASKTDPVHFLQIWLMPARAGLPAAYEQRSFQQDERSGKLRVVASPDGREGSLTINQDASMHVALLAAGETVAHALAPERAGYVFVAQGEIDVGGHRLTAGDGAAITDQPRVDLAGTTGGEVLLFDLP